MVATYGDMGINTFSFSLGRHFRSKHTIYDMDRLESVSEMMFFLYHHNSPELLAMSRTCRTKLEQYRADVVRCRAISPLVERMSYRYRRQVFPTRSKLVTCRRRLLHDEKLRQMETCVRHVYEYVRAPHDISSTRAREENSRENFKPFKVLSSPWRVLAT